VESFRQVTGCEKSAAGGGMTQPRSGSTRNNQPSAGVTSKFKSAWGTCNVQLAGTVLPVVEILHTEIVQTDLQHWGHGRSSPLFGLRVCWRFAISHWYWMHILVLLHKILGSNGGEYENGCLLCCCASTSDTPVNFYQTTRRNNPEDSAFLVLLTSMNLEIRLWWYRNQDTDQHNE
jgi:hypothetical protein